MGLGLLRRDATAYLSLIFLGAVVGRLLHFAAPNVPVYKGQSWAVLVQAAFVAASVIAWAVLRWHRTRDALFHAFMAGYLAFAAFLISLSFVRNDWFNPSVMLLPLVLLMVWLKPPSSQAAIRATDIAAVAFIAISIASQVLQALGVASTQSEFELRWAIFPDWSGIDMRWQGPFGNVNNAGPVGAFLVAYGIGRSRWQRWLFIGAGAWIIMIAQTRASLVSVTAAVAVFIVFPTEQSRIRFAGWIRYPAAMVAALGVALFLLLSATGLNGRGPVWSVFLEAWRQEPLLGIGGGGIEALRQGGILPGWANHGHSIPIDVLGRYGSIGFVLLSLVLITAFALTGRAALRGAPLGLAVVVAFAVGGLVDTQLDWRYFTEAALPLSAASLISAAAFREGRSQRRSLAQQRLESSQTSDMGAAQHSPSVEADRGEVR